VISNGRDIEKYTYDEQARLRYRKKLGLEGKTVIGHVGHFSASKNHAFLIDIFHELSVLDPGFFLILIGDGPLRPEIERRIVEYGLERRISLMGCTNEVAQLLQAMDIMLLPSIYEGLPIAALEWQIACLPCLISDKVTAECKITELVEFLPLENGPKAWADKIAGLRICDRSEIAERIRGEVRKAGYDIKENANLLRQKYQRMIGKIAILDHRMSRRGLY
jgi:glycosyltransferase involved in cell wall biosynthesis